MTNREYEFFDMIKRHDYFYVYADDQLSYRKGKEGREKINLHIKAYPDDRWVWERYCRSVDHGKWPLTLEELCSD